MALESCEFWSAFCEASVEPGVLQPFLGRLIPVLLKNMVYDEYDEEVGEAEAAEEAALSGQAPAEDREQEVKPFIARCGPTLHMCRRGTPVPWTQLLVFGALLDFVNLWAAPGVFRSALRLQAQAQYLHESWHSTRCVHASSGWWSAYQPPHVERLS